MVCSVGLWVCSSQLDVSTGVWPHLPEGASAACQRQMMCIHRKLSKPRQRQQEAPAEHNLEMLVPLCR